MNRFAICVLLITGFAASSCGGDEGFTLKSIGSAFTVQTDDIVDSFASAPNAVLVGTVTSPPDSRTMKAADGARVSHTRFKVRVDQTIVGGVAPTITVVVPGAVDRKARTITMIEGLVNAKDLMDHKHLVFFLSAEVDGLRPIEAAFPINGDKVASLNGKVNGQVKDLKAKHAVGQQRRKAIRGSRPALADMAVGFNKTCKLLGGANLRSGLDSKRQAILVKLIQNVNKTNIPNGTPKDVVTLWRSGQRSATALSNGLARKAGSESLLDHFSTLGSALQAIGAGDCSVLVP